MNLGGSGSAAYFGWLSSRLVSYRPANQAHDGKFRKIEVKVSQPQAKVRARGGYYAPPPTN